MTNFIFSFLRSGAGVLISRVFGLIRDVAIGIVFGATAVTDVFFVALAIPNLFREFFVEGAMSSAFMPFLAEKYKKGGRAAQNLYLTQIVIMQTFFVTVISVIIMVFADYVLRIFLRGKDYLSDAALMSMGADLIHIMMPFLILICIIGMFSGFLNINRSYFISYASSALFNICMILGAWVAYHNSKDITYLAYGVIAGGVLQLIIVYFVSMYYGYRPKFSKTLDEDVKKTYLLLVPSLAGVSISQLNFVIGRILTSYLAQGSISWLFYASRLFQFPLGVFSVTLGVVSLTELSKARADNDLVRRNEIINKAFLSLFIIIIPATIGLIGLSTELIKFVFQDLSSFFIHKTSAFSDESVLKTSIALKMYASGLIFFSLANLLTRVFHSEKNTKTPVKCAFFAFIANVIFSLILMQFLAHAGIALAGALAAVVNASLLFYHIKDFKFDVKNNAQILVKVLFANIIMGLSMVICQYFGIYVLINIAVCIIVYFAALKLMKINILRLLR